MNIFQIPKKGENQCDLVIGIIDASGSMENCWEQVANSWNNYIDPSKSITIVFDTVSNIVESNILDPIIHYHGGGGTNLYRAFNLFEKKLEQLKDQMNITVIFISDGQDNNKTLCKKRLDKLKGIGKDFPTFIALQLREKYHNGDDQIPAIFLIEYASQKAFDNKFELLKEHFEMNKKRNITPSVCLFPWKEYQNIVYENSWVLCHEDQVKIDDEIIEVKEYNLNLQGLSELLRSWSQMIHLESLEENSSSQQKAQKTLSIIEDILQELKDQKNMNLIELLNLEQDEDKLNFKEKAWLNFVKQNYGRIKWYYDDIKNTAEGNTIQNINQFEAAKIVGIGTIVGNQKQKILQNKGISIEQFKIIKREFQKIYTNTKLIPYSSQEASIITLQNQKDFFMDDDFIQGLIYCQNQYDLIKCFPLIGVAIKIIPNKDHPQNPWVGKITLISKFNKSVDSTSIINNHGGINLLAGDRHESITGVLPLFGIQDQDLQPLITSDLYSLLMTQNVLKTVDILIKNSYLGLLSQSLCYILKNYEDKQYINEYINGIFTTEQIIQKNNFEYLKYKTNFIKNPIITFENDPESTSLNIELYNKGIICLFSLMQDNKITKEIFQDFCNYLAMTFVYNLIIKEGKLDQFCKLGIQKLNQIQNLEDVVQSRVKQQFKDFYTIGDFKRCIVKEYIQCYNNCKFEIDWNLDKAFNIETIIDYKLIKNLMSYFKQQENFNNINWKNYVALVMQGHKPNHLKYLQGQSLDKEIQLGNQKILNELQKRSKVKNKQKTLKGTVRFQNLYKVLFNKFKKYFDNIHWQIIPPTKQELDKFYKENPDMNRNKLQFKKCGLPLNACASKKCKYYLIPKQRLSRHLNIWGNKLPYQFHTIVQENKNKNNEEIYQIFIKRNTNLNLSFLQKTKQDIMKYIQNVKENLN